MLIIKIQNDGTGTVEVGNYRYQVMVNDTVIESGDVKGHKRKKGWQQLLLDLVCESLYWQKEHMIEMASEMRKEIFTGDSDHEHDDRIL